MQDIEAEWPVQRVFRARAGGLAPRRPPDAANVLGRGFDGHRPRTHVAADLTYVRAGSRWCHVCLLVDRKSVV